MLNVKILESCDTVILEPTGKLTQKDFESAASIIDPFIEKSDKLKGIIIHVQSFPWWDSFSSFISHLEFVREHHKKVTRVAIVTDSLIGTFGEQIASHFLEAKIKDFPFDELPNAIAWVSS